jgi:hypothetical protein
MRGCKFESLPDGRQAATPAESISGKTIDVSELDRGMYTLRLISSVAKEANFKVILE